MMRVELCGMILSFSERKPPSLCLLGVAEDKNTSCLQPGGASEVGEWSRAGEFFGEEAQPSAAYRCCPVRSSACPLLLTTTRAMASRLPPSHGDTATKTHPKHPTRAHQCSGPALGIDFPKKSSLDMKLDLAVSGCAALYEVAAAARFLGSSACCICVRMTK